MTRYLLNEPPPDLDPSELAATELSWTCLEPECGQSVTDIHRHTSQAHSSETVEIFTSRASLEQVVHEQLRRAAIKIPDPPKPDAIARYAKHFGISRRDAKTALFQVMYSGPGELAEADLDTFIDSLIEADKAHRNA